MKKILILIIILLLILPVFGETGSWSFEPLFTRLPDNTLIPSGLEYSLPFAGMEGMDFIDDFLVRILVSGEYYRAFYEIIPGDADNSTLVLTFKGGQSLTVQLVSMGLEYLFFYQIPEGFFTAFSEPEELSEGFVEEADKKPASGDEPDVMETDPEADPAVEPEDEPEYWYLNGYFRKQDSTRVY